MRRGEITIEAGTSLLKKYGVPVSPSVKATIVPAKKVDLFRSEL